MLKLFKNLFKKTTCEHVYELAQSTFIDAGMRKICVYRCEVCGKERTYFM